ncbi:MAG TPA: Lrp/AsnC family transcriptional regulator [Alphaproteobacteria bacterium]|nr:Lrp/AsnC family transcriptional regulator [Alphaproteobacteria bacterium]
MVYQNKKFDYIDLKIISILQKDSSKPIKDISKKVGLSISPCWNRIQKLQDLGIIKHKTVILNPEKLGYSNRVFVFIKTNQHKKKWSDNFKDYILKQPNVIGLYRISGAYDYLIDVLAKDIKDFDLFYKNLIENIEIFEVSSSFVMEIMKETTNIPILNEL